VSPRLDNSPPARITSFMRTNPVQLAWPFALIGVAVGAQLPTAFASAVILALVLALFGALVTSAIERVHDWQVAIMSPAVGAITGAMLGWNLDGLDSAAVGCIAGLGFGLLALPALVLLTDGARRASRLPGRSLVGRAQRRRVWLLAFSTTALATLAVPALANPWSRPSEAPLAQLMALGTMLMALGDAALWIVTAQSSRRSTADSRQSANPYRESAVPEQVLGANVLPVLAAESLLYDALVVAVVAAALLVSR
jgi:hypothetical protein